MTLSASWRAPRSGWSAAAHRRGRPVSGQNVGVQIMSVTGPVQPRDLGVVLPHEHVFADLVREYLDRAWFDRHAVEAIADEMVRDVEEGVRDPGIRAGIIGEIGADRWYVSAAEGRSFRAAARAHLQTGLTISTHAARWPLGLPLLIAAGLEEAEVRRFVTANPRAALTGEPLT
jgi:predicted metal-dependent phosphotriesterase family hydrolase